MGQELYNRIYFKGKRYKLANVLWNICHPDDPVMSDEMVHHKDGDKKNDDPSNHEKMTKKAHKSLHSQAGIDALNKWRKENPGKSTKMSQQNQKKMLTALQQRKSYVMSQQEQEVWQKLAEK